MCSLAALLAGVTIGRKSATDSIIASDAARKSEIIQEEYLSQFIDDISGPDEFDLMCYGIMDLIDEYRRTAPPDVWD